MLLKDCAGADRATIILLKADLRRAGRIRYTGRTRLHGQQRNNQTIGRETQSIARQRRRTPPSCGVRIGARRGLGSGGSGPGGGGRGRGRGRVGVGVGVGVVSIGVQKNPKKKIEKMDTEEGGGREGEGGGGKGVLLGR